MLGSHEIEDILERLREWLVETDVKLEQLDYAAVKESFGLPSHDDGTAFVGLLQMVEAVTALRQEVKLQTKSTRGLADRVQTSEEELHRAIQRLGTFQAEEAAAADRAARPLVEALINLDEALLRAAKAIDATQVARPDPKLDDLQDGLEDQFRKLPWWRRLISQYWHDQVVRQYSERATQDKNSSLDKLLDGFHLIQARVSKQLAECQIKRITCVGHRVDPETMHVVDLIDDSSRTAITNGAEHGCVFSVSKNRSTGPCRAKRIVVARAPARVERRGMHGPGARATNEFFG